MQKFFLGGGKKLRVDVFFWEGVYSRNFNGDGGHCYNFFPNWGGGGGGLLKWRLQDSGLGRENSARWSRIFSEMR